MTFFKSLKENRSSNGDTLISQYIGSRGNAPINITGYNALAHSAVNACSSLIVDAISTLPVDVYIKKGGRSVPVDAPEVISNPSAYCSDVDWRRQILLSWIFAGNTFGQSIRYDKFFNPLQIELFDPFNVSVLQDPETGEVRITVNGKEVNSSQLFFEPGMLLPGQRIGVSLLSYAATGITRGLIAEKTAQEYYTKGIKPAGLISMPGAKGTQEQADDVKERFISAAQNANEPIVLFGDTKYTPYNGMTAADSKFLESANASAQDVARFFNVPPELIGLESGSSMTYSNIESRSLHVLKYTLNPWIVRLEKALTKLVPGNQFVKINRDAALSVDLLTRYQSYAIGLEHQFLVPNEPRDLEDRLPLPGGDIPIPRNNSVQGQNNDKKQ